MSKSNAEDNDDTERIYLKQPLWIVSNHVFFSFQALPFLE